MNTVLDWTKAEEHLRELAAQYTNNFIGVMHYCNWILILKRRFDAGERTEELYNEIMAEE